jgi:hypothetical protein
MVTSARLPARLFAALLFAPVMLSGCRVPVLSAFWGEPPIAQGILDLAQQGSGPACESPLEILTAEDDSRSHRILRCWTKISEKIFEQVKGEHPGRITASEIRYLISRRVIAFSGIIEQDQRRTEAVLGLAGFEEATLAEEDLRRWFDWIAENRFQLRRSYALWRRSPEEAPRRFEDFHSLAMLVASALRQSSFHFSPTEMARAWEGAANPDDPDWRRALGPVSRTLFEVASTLCPNLSQWDADVIAGCLERSVNGLSAAPNYIEWVLNPIPATGEGSRFDAERAELLAAELEEVSERFQDWFTQPGLGTVSTRHWIEMMNALGATLPADIADRLGWIEKLKGRSTSKEIHPSAIARFFKVAGRAQVRIWRALPVYQRALQESRCRSVPGMAAPTSWRDCAYSGDPIPSAAHPGIRWALQIRNMRWGMEAAPLTGRRLSQMAYFAELAEEVLQAFDADHDGIIQASTLEREDEILDLVASVLQAMESWEQLIVNLENKWNGHRMLEAGPVLPMTGLSLHGLARLLAMSSDVLVVRDTPEERNALKEIFGILWNVFPRSSLFMDSKSLASVFVMALSLGDFSEAYAREFDAFQELLVSDPRGGAAPVRARFVSVGQLRESLPQILGKHFPRMAASCHRWGWEQSCGKAFLKIIPQSEEHPGFVKLADLDLITILGASLEGLFDSCDVDGNGRLEAGVLGGLLSGDDELDCAVTRAKDATLRLMDSQVLRIEGFWQRTGTQLALQATNAIFVGRHFGKLSIIRGKPVLVPLWGMWRAASLGSMVSLLGNLAE